MRFADIKVGESYYFDRGRDWLVGSYHPVYRAVVVDNKRYHFSKLGRAWSEHPQGEAVRCDLYHPGDGEKVRQEYVRAANLRGDWESTKAAVDANRQRRGRVEQERRKHKEQQREQAKRAGEAAEVIGVSTTYAYRDGRIEVPAEQFLAMATQLSQAGWKYEGASE